MKILIKNDLLIGGGVEYLLSQIVYRLRENGHRVVIDSNQDQIIGRELFGSEVSFLNNSFIKVRGRRFSLGWFITRFIYFLQRNFRWAQIVLSNYDVVIALKEGPIMKDVASIIGARKIAWVHVDYSSFHWTKFCFKSDYEENRCMRKFDRVVCVSNAAKSAIERTIGDPGNLCVKYNPINVDRIIELSREECDIIRKDDKVILISVGRLAFPKNQILQLEACQKLRKKYDFELYIIGDGPDRNDLESYISEHHMDNIHLLGNCSNPYSYVKQADIFINTSISESYCIAIQEALVLGVPVLAVVCPAISESLSTDFGIITDSILEVFARDLESLISNKSLRDKYKNNIFHLYDTGDLFESRLESIYELIEGVE